MFLVFRRKPPARGEGDAVARGGKTGADGGKPPAPDVGRVRGRAGYCFFFFFFLRFSLRILSVRLTRRSITGLGVE